MEGDATPQKECHLTMVFTDLVESALAKTVLGDEKGSHLITKIHRYAVTLLKEEHGLQRNFYGDGHLLSFMTVADAVRFSLRLQKSIESDDELKEARKRTQLPDLLSARIGIHRGDVREIQEEGEKEKQIMGSNVDLTARIMSLARPRQVLSSYIVYFAALNAFRDNPVENFSVNWKPHGYWTFKGFDGLPLEIYEVGLDGFSPFQKPDSADKAQRAPDPATANAFLDIAPEKISSSPRKIQDLTKDPLLKTMPRAKCSGHSLPVIGKYGVFSNIGGGGTSCVYLAYDPQRDGYAALKVLLDPTPDMILRMKNEFKMLNKVKSVGVYETGEWGGLHFIAMEYIDGESAESYLKKNGGVDERTTLEICIAAAKQLADAHDHGIIHRDVKPGNIMIPKLPDGSLNFKSSCLTDFGLAKDGKLNRATSQAGGMGTPGFMSPEQQQDVRCVGKATDVYAMGATLYYLLTDRLPFPSEQIPTLQAIANLRLDIPKISVTTASVIDKCLHRNTAERFPDAQKMLGEMEKCLLKLGPKEPEIIKLGPKQSKPPDPLEQPKSPQGAYDDSEPPELPEDAEEIRHPRRHGVAAAIICVIAIIAISILLLENEHKPVSAESLKPIPPPPVMSSPQPKPPDPLVESVRVGKEKLGKDADNFESEQKQKNDGGVNIAAFWKTKWAKLKDDATSLLGDAIGGGKNFSNDINDLEKLIARIQKNLDAWDEKMEESRKIAKSDEEIKKNKDAIRDGLDGELNKLKTRISDLTAQQALEHDNQNADKIIEQWEDMQRDSGRMLAQARITQLPGQISELTNKIVPSIDKELKLSKARKQFRMDIAHRIDDLNASILKLKAEQGLKPDDIAKHDGEAAEILEALKKEDSASPDIARATEIVRSMNDMLKSLREPKNTEKESKILSALEDIKAKIRSYKQKQETERSNVDEWVDKWSKLQTDANELLTSAKAMDDPLSGVVVELTSYISSIEAELSLWRRKAKFRLKIAESKELFEKLKDAKQCELVERGRKLLEEAVSLAIDKPETDQAEELQIVWKNKKTQLDAEQDHNDFQGELSLVNARLERMEKDEKDFHGAARSLQNLQEQFESRDDIVSELNKFLSEKRNELSDQVVGTLKTGTFGVDMEREILWAASVATQAKSYTEKLNLPQLYEMPSPGDAVFSAEFPNLKSAMRKTKTFLSQASLGAVYNAYEKSMARKELQDAAGWYSDNVTLHSYLLPSNGSQELARKQTVFVPDPKQHSWETVDVDNMALVHRAHVLREGVEFDAGRDVRLANTDANFFVRVAGLSAAKTAKSPQNEDWDFLPQISSIGIRSSIDEAGKLKAVGRVFPKHGTNLEIEFQKPPRFFSTRTLAPLSTRTIYVATASPDDVIVKYSLQALIVSSNDTNAEKETAKQHAKQKQLLDSIDTILQGCEAQFSVALDQDIKNEEVLVFVSDDTSDWKSIIKINEVGSATGTDFAARLKLDTLENFKPLTVVQDQKDRDIRINGYGFNYKNKPFELRYVQARNAVLLVFGRTTLPYISEALERLQKYSHGSENTECAEATVLQAKLGGKPGSYAIARPSMFFGANGQSIVFTNSRMSRVSSFTFEIGTDAVSKFMDAVILYGVEGERKDSWIAEGMRIAGRTITGQDEKDATSKVEEPATYHQQFDESLYDRRLIDFAIPVLTGLTIGDGNMIADAASTARQKGGDLKFKKEEDRILHDAILELADAHGNRGDKIEKDLRPQRFSMARDPATPPWREALLDIVISQARGKGEKSVPYAEGGANILKEYLNDESVKPSDPILELQAVIEAWRTCVLLDKYNDASLEAKSDELEIFKNARSLLSISGSKIWNGDRLLSKLRKYIP